MKNSIILLFWSSIVLFNTYKYIYIEKVWESVNLPESTRYDDIFFTNNSIGWVAGGTSGKVFKTIDGGSTWKKVLEVPKYLRSIEFINETDGFCGSVDSAFYQTKDGGKTWIDISKNITPTPLGICGLSIPDKNTIYGCGVFYSPAFIISSYNKGDSWAYQDMSKVASALVDIHFLNSNEGFAIGKGNPESVGGIVLHTINGGKTWDLVYQTYVSGDYIWKIQQLDSKRFFASVASLPNTNNIRMIKSENGGKTWKSVKIADKYDYIQAVGFIDSTKGWIGGAKTLYYTSDGGKTWNLSCSEATNFNRFFKVNNSKAFLTGSNVYKLKD